VATPIRNDAAAARMAAAGVLLEVPNGRRVVAPVRREDMRFDYGDPTGQATPPPGFESVQWMRCWMTGLTDPPWAVM
jgi:hypothetical protein